MTDFKVGDRVTAPRGFCTSEAVTGTIRIVDHDDARWRYLVTMDSGVERWTAIEDTRLDGPDLTVLLGQLEAAHKAIDELSGDIDRANTLVGALEALLAATQDRACAETRLHEANSELDDAEKAYNEARATFDTNGGESS